jgi:hypothetical protein
MLEWVVAASSLIESAEDSIFEAFSAAMSALKPWAKVMQ